MRFTRIVVVLLVAGLALVAVGIVVGGPTSTVRGEAVSFTRASGSAAYSRVWDFDFHFDGNLWIDAGLAFCAVALVAAIRPRAPR
jgi:hypothetical protein